MKRRRLPSRALLVSLGIPTVFVPGLLLAALLGWDWRAGLARLQRAGGFRQSRQIFPQFVRVTEVLDGDTFNTDRTFTVRLIGIDAPNRGQPGYQEAKEYLADLIGGEEVRLEYDRYQDDKYGRILAYVWERCSTQVGCRNGWRLVNWVMLKKRLARLVTYQDRRPLKYQELFRQAALSRQ